MTDVYQLRCGQPFVDGEADVDDERPVRRADTQQAIGELVTCTRCVGTWAAAGLASTQILAPRVRPPADVVARRRGSERLSAGGFTALTGKAN